MLMTETLYSLRLNGLMYAKSELTAPWGIDMPPMEGKMMFHISEYGYLERRGEVFILEDNWRRVLPAKVNSDIF